MRDRDGAKLPNLLGCDRGGTVHRPGAKIVADQDPFLLAERVDEAEHVARERLRISVVRWNLGRPISTHERADGAIPLLCDQRTNLFPGMCLVGEAMKEQDERPSPFGEVGEANAIGVYVLNVVRR